MNKGKRGYGDIRNWEKHMRGRMYKEEKFGYYPESLRMINMEIFILFELNGMEKR